MRQQGVCGHRRHGWRRISIILERQHGWNAGVDDLNRVFLIIDLQHLDVALRLLFAHAEILRILGPIVGRWRNHEPSLLARPIGSDTCELHVHFLSRWVGWMRDGSGYRPQAEWISYDDHMIRIVCWRVNTPPSGGRQEKS